MMGIAGLLIVYLEPSALAVSDHNLVRSWDINFFALGYPPVELAERLRAGFAWSALTGLSYMLIVVGGHLIVTIYRLSTEFARSPDANDSGRSDGAMHLSSPWDDPATAASHSGAQPPGYTNLPLTINSMTVMRLMISRSWSVASTISNNSHRKFAVPARCIPELGNRRSPLDTSVTERDRTCRSRRLAEAYYTGSST